MRAQLQSELEECEDEERKKELQGEMRSNDKGIEVQKQELQEATEELGRLENEEGNDATSECVCTYLYCEWYTVCKLMNN